jgi:transketolase
LLDREAVLALARETNLIVTVEEHGVTGGLGSALAEVIAREDDRGVRVIRLGIKDKFHGVTGGREFLLGKAGLSVSGIVRTSLEHVRRWKKRD